MFYPPSWFDDMSQAFSDLKFSLQMHFHVVHSVCDTTCLWVTMFVFICFSLPQSITICICVMSICSSIWCLWGTGRIGRSGTSVTLVTGREKIFAARHPAGGIWFRFAWSPCRKVWRNTHWQSLSFFACVFLLGGSLLSRRLSLICSGCYRVAVMQGSFKTSEASSNHVLFTKQKGVRQIHSSCQKKQMVLRCITVSTCIAISSMIWILKCLHLSLNTPTKFTRYAEGKAEINGFSPSFSSFRSFHRSGEAQ